jgi:hypothetical protein
MLKKMKNVVFALVLGMMATMIVSDVFADDWPLVGGDYWEVTGVTIKDGGDLKYASWLATEWKKNLEFAQSKGWIKGHMIFANVYPREGEPDLYLVRIIESVVSAAEGEKRSDEYQEWSKKTYEQMDSESGNRAEYREVGGTSLLQELNFRK